MKKFTEEALSALREGLRLNGRAFTVGLDMGGIQLRPIRLRRSLYLRIPMEVAQLLGVTKDTGFLLTLKQGEDCILMYKVA